MAEPGIRRAAYDQRTVVLRSAGGRRRLFVTPAEAQIVEADFLAAASVPEVLTKLLAEHRCPPLRDFYELILQAHAAGVLVAPDAVPGRPAAAKWPLKLPVRLGSWLGTTALVLGLAGLAWTSAQWRLPDSVLALAAGWALACLWLSAGQALAASAIEAAGAEARRARLSYWTLLPHFQVDIAEATMGGPRCEQAVAVLRLLPVVAGAALLAWKWPAGAAPSLAALLLLLSPLPGSAALQWLQARWGRPVPTVGGSALFQPFGRDTWYVWKSQRTRLGSKLGLAVLALVGAWLFLVAWVVERWVPEATRAVARFKASGASHPLLAAAEYTLIAAAVVLPLAYAARGFRHWRLGRSARQPIRGRDARPANLSPLGGSKVDWLAQVPLFGELSAEERTALADRMETLEAKRGQCVVAENETGFSFYLLVAGELEVRKQLPQSRKSSTIGWLGPGDGFGEISLLEDSKRTASVIAARPSTILRLARADFEQQVVNRIGVSRVRQTLQYARFLGRLGFAAGLPWDQLSRFAARCTSMAYEAGAVILRRGDPNIWFFLVYDGHFEAREGERVLRRMGPGDYFAEISLLEGSRASADVVAVEQARCLLLGRSDFLELIAADFRLGLRIEAAAAMRLGSDVLVNR